MPSGICCIVGVDFKVELNRYRGGWSLDDGPLYALELSVIDR
jgi:hypothetical protein